MRIEYHDTLSAKDFCYLRNSVGFSSISEDQAQMAIEKSDFITSATINNITVGMIRLITDGLQALIMDLIVHPNYQRKGIGKELMKRTILYVHNMANENKILINLITDNSKVQFYEEFGFNQTVGMRMRAGKR